MSRGTRANQSSVSSSLGEELQKYFESPCFITTMKKVVFDVLKEESFQEAIKDAGDKAVSKAVGSLTSKLAEVDSLVQRVNVLQETVRGLDSKLLVVQNTSESALLKSNDNEQYSRKYNLRFVGIKEQENENCVDLIVKFFKDQLEVAVDVRDIDRAHRVATKTTEKTRAIIVKFKNYNSKMVICKRTKHLKGSNFYINEDLTTINMKLFYFRRTNATQIKSIWPSDGKLLAHGDDDKIVRIRSNKDFERYNLV